ncbi:DEAD/DEAH box helicase [Thermocoleostomius sinensis]|uniref:RNA helicase n=1 Tax=Thermocoleostomius sinensis A174 TaxID=2016057 RepID=A0A9E8Z807_9CYAN|nr:RNA helicase [Thermocoleostomius sinensis]WAL58180.1 RNA helicase [Thermocoleostomius sinensis A174]
MNLSSGATQLDLTNVFPFELDDFQKQAIAALDAGQSVVVCAPTGSGKTLIGEYAIYRALARGKRVFYTTPLKALSNQKLRDFRERFGADRVGLLTGDASINRDAPILVMTTEIFRNMLYGTPIGQVGTSLVDVEAVVLDECHYMNDRQRGTVWEESIIYAPPLIQLVALSATIANSDQLTDWIRQVHGPTQLVYSNFRPVPLVYHFCNPKGLFPLLDNKRKAINSRLKPKGGRQRGRQDAPSLLYVVSQLQQRDMLPAIYFIFSRKGCDKAVAELEHLSLVNRAEAAALKYRIDAFLQRSPEAARTGHIEPLYRGIAAHHAGVLPAWKGLIEELFQEGLIKIVFATETLAAGINMPARTTVISSLSKRTDRGHRLLNASEFLQMAGRAGRRGMDDLGHVVTIQTPFEGATDAAYLATSGADPLVSQFTPSYGMVLNLLQTHTLQQAQDLVERSFGNYLSTLYLKPQQQGIEALTAELERQRAQMPDVSPDLLTSYEKLHDRLKEERRLLRTLMQQARETAANHLAASLSFAVAGTVLSLKGKHVPVTTPLPAVLVVKIPGSGQFPYFICLSQTNRWHVVAVGDVVGMHPEFPRIAEVDHLVPPMELSPRAGAVRKGDELTLPIAQQIPDIPPDTTVPPEVQDQQGRMAAVEAQLQAHPLHEFGDPGQIVKRAQRLIKLEEDIASRQSKLERYSQRYWQEFLNLMEILEYFGCLERIDDFEELEREQHDWQDCNGQQPLDGYTDSDNSWEDDKLNHSSPKESSIERTINLADDLVDEVDESVAPNMPRERWLTTTSGEIAAAIRGDNELWLGLAIASGELDALDPHHLAAACAALVTEVSRPDTWTRYESSPEVEAALAGLRRIRRELFKLQRRYQVALPVWLEADLVGLVEQWALGVEWSDLCGNTTLDEGDVVRILRRTVDFLSQIPHVPHIGNELKQNANRAIQLIDRFPVNESVD